MTRQTIAENWKTIHIGYDKKTNTFTVTERSLGRFTAATAAEKVTAKYPSHSYSKAKGYWVRQDGDVIKLLPAYI